MTYDEVVGYFGTAYRAAKELGTSSQALSIWKRNGAIPELMQYRIEVMTKGELKASPPRKGKHYCKRKVPIEIKN